MNKYLIGSKYTIPMVTDEVPAGSLLSVTWTLTQIEPVSADAPITGDFLAVDNPSGQITLPTATLPRSVWRLAYTLTNNLSVAYSYQVEFILEQRPEDTLIEGVNSFMNYYQAMLTAEEISGLQVFNAASKQEQIRALTAAYTILVTMVYADNTGDHYDIGSYDAARLAQLEPAFLRALRLAMLIEANEMLDANSIHYKRLDGIMSETIGESSMMFRPGNIQNFAITRRSMNFLSNYVVIRARLYRA